MAVAVESRMPMQLGSSFNNTGGALSTPNAATFIHDLQNQAPSSQNLNAIQQDNSADRIRQFCDTVGVTDRYTGYRHNLNRGQRDPQRLGNAWLVANAYNRSRNQGRSMTAGLSAAAAPQKSVSFAASPRVMSRSVSAPVLPREALARRTTGNLLTDPAMEAHQRRVKSGPTKSIQEQCGINTVFPGRTEYMRRYGPPDLSGNVSGFVINPSPNFYKHGRNLMHLHPPRSQSEHQARFTWPSGDRIPRMPWLRK